MIDARLVQALDELIHSGESGVIHQHACLIGGQAIRDLFRSLVANIGPDVRPFRASQDLDLLIVLQEEDGAGDALVAHLRERWRLMPNRPATYQWLNDPEVQLDLSTTYQVGETPGRSARITLRGTGRVLGYGMIPAWLHAMNLIEPCFTPELRRIGLERLRHTALLVSKMLAVGACIHALATEDPPAWTSRLDRDLVDILYLTDRQIRSGLWCAACTTKRQDIEREMAPTIAQVRAAAFRPPEVLDTGTRDRLQTVADALGTWWTARPA